MSLLWPGFLLLLGLVPLLVAAYIWVLRRQRVGLRYSSLSLVRMALPRYSRIRRHIPFALFLLALSGLIVALSRPVNIVAVPTGQATIMLTLDVSGSMRQRDIAPSRLAAAQQAALQFIQDQKQGTEIGIVAFAGYAQLVQPPTADKDALRLAIESLTVGRGTAIGSGILQSLDTISQLDTSVAPPDMSGTPSEGPQPAVPKGAYAPDIIVLLTDGVTTTGPMPLDAARQAADRGVRVYTIGFGTEQGSGDFGQGGFGGRGNLPSGGFPGGGRGGFRMGIDEPTLQQIASMTDGKYYTASSAGELQKVFQDLPVYLIIKHEVMELSVLFTGLGALFMIVAIAFAMRWHPLP